MFVLLLIKNILANLISFQLICHVKCQIATMVAMNTAGNKNNSKSVLFLFKNFQSWNSEDKKNKTKTHIRKEWVANCKISQQNYHFRVNKEENSLEMKVNCI